jgi:hypothetical protein
MRNIIILAPRPLRGGSFVALRIRVRSKRIRPEQAHHEGEEYDQNTAGYSQGASTHIGPGSDNR